jgi:FkbM family methyltransferase
LKENIAVCDIYGTKPHASGSQVVAYLKSRTKDVLRGMLPAQLRFIRSGKLFLAYGGPEVQALHQLVEHGSTAVDIGAHVGAYTYALCQHVGTNGHVIAVEPIPDLADLLRRATTRLGLPVTVFDCALSSRDGEADLLIPVHKGIRRPGLATLEKHSAAGLRRQVSLRRLDELCRDVPGRISFIKIDVEGHELEVLRGGINTLRRHRPNLLVEIEQRHSPVPIGETFQFLTSLGYAGEFLDRTGRRCPLACFDVTEHQMRHLCDIGTPAYVNNFIFWITPPDGTSEHLH